MWLSPHGFAPCGPEVENVITVQKSRDTLEVEGEKKSVMKKMMVKEAHTVLWHWVGTGQKS